MVKILSSPEGSSIIFLFEFVACKVNDFNDGFLRDADHNADNISNFIVSYAVTIPNLAVRNFSWLLLFVVPTT